ncbi:MAG: CaiB/BaiF CoA transferase family protein [Candidatus Binataceae bacterium]
MAEGPFSGVTVIDLTHVLSGPFCTMILADLGARVIKVEHRGRGGDDTRHFPPYVDGMSIYFASVNRGKESIALEFNDPADREILNEMIRRGDILVENLRFETLEHLGLDYAALQRLNPRIIYGTISGFGGTGPLRNRGAYDPIAEAMGGMMSINGQPGGPPTKVGTSIMDYFSGAFCTAGLAAALYQRERTGRGAMVDIAMLDAQVSVLEAALVHALNGGSHIGRIGSRHPVITPGDTFPTADREIYFCATTEEQWRSLCATIGGENLAADPRFDSLAHRHENQDALTRELAPILKTRTTAQWIGAFHEAKVPCSPVNTVEETIELPQLAARNMIVSDGTIRMAGNPVKMSTLAETPVYRRAPEFDADGARIRAEFAPRLK